MDRLRADPLSLLLPGSTELTGQEPPSRFEAGPLGYNETSRLVDIAQSFNGAVFDGRYITIINSTSAPLSAQVRYDTQGDFVSAGWTSFYPNTSTIGALARSDSVAVLLSSLSSST